MLAVVVMILGSVPIVVFEVLPIVVATWFLEVCFACLDLGSIPTVAGHGLCWKFTYRRLGSVPTIGPAWWLEVRVASARLVLVRRSVPTLVVISLGIA